MEDRSVLEPVWVGTWNCLSVPVPTRNCFFGTETVDTVFFHFFFQNGHIGKKNSENMFSLNDVTKRRNITDVQR